jgi:hypothetical protein
MVSTKGLLQWMARTLMVRFIEALPTSLSLTGNVCIEWAMDSPDPAAAGRIATRCLIVLNMTIGPVAGVGIPVCIVRCNPMSIVFALKECVGRCCAIT